MDFENKKVKELAKFAVDSYSKTPNINSFKKRLQVLYKYYNKEGKGVMPFVFGKDYYPDIEERKIEMINPQYLVIYEQRKKAMRT